MEQITWKVTDIAGSRILDEDGNVLGELIDVLPTGHNDVWVVRGPEGTELLVPALKTVVRSVDVEHKTIVVALPAGLKEVFEEHQERRIKP